MLQGFESVFRNMSMMTKGLKKATYERYTQEFVELYGKYFQEMTCYVQESEDKKRASREIGDTIVSAVKKAHGGKKGRVDTRTQAELTLFMVYYVFPTILKQEEYGETIADGVLAAWREGFGNRTVRYADYDTLYHGFREKVLGLF